MAGLIAATGAEAAAAAPMAAPAAMTTTGKVLAVDTKHGTVTLSNKGVFVFGKGPNLFQDHRRRMGDHYLDVERQHRDASKIVASKSTGMMM